MDKAKTLSLIQSTGLVAVVRADTPDEALEITDACLSGGIKAIEITFTVPDALDIIKSLTASRSKDDILIGAGTVLDEITARLAILSGASYIVTPYFIPEVLSLCHRYQIPCIPGAMTICEVAMALEAGADIIKVFPGEVVGSKFIKAVLGPLPHAKLMPTGGVSVENVSEWISAGAVAVGAGGSLTTVTDGNYELITQRAKAFLKNIQEARH